MKSFTAGYFVMFAFIKYFRQKYFLFLLLKFQVDDMQM